ncbi:hypothetical protein VPNG_05843 [Cytospora leucostoma]|uniref:ubiquitinyl hydrolase 1 n=1 Tax=Cytospora leucostoma TaxID=1230097 RepID=A0A423X0K3_9PEZI|nr:hypothetical protein VPNG_05843 [Cytospora leucostoma]
MASFPPETLEFFRHHLFLHPGLPQQDDHNSGLESALLQLVHEALEQFGGLVPEEQRPTVRYVASAISQLIDTRNANDGFVNEERLFEALNRMCEEDSPAVIPLHISAQNAGILFRKQSNGIQFEAFELSPCNQAAMSTQGRLQRCFPGPVLCIDKDELRQPDYLSTLAKALSKSSFQTAPGMMPTVRKSRNEIEEHRDTCHPGVVTELIVAHLQPISTVPTTQQRIWKNTREEVLWENTSLPWRRSPLWLLLRTVMQLLFTQSQVARSSEPVTTTSRCLYKLFMVYLLAVVLSKSLAVNDSTKPDILLCMSAKISRRLLKLNPAEQVPGIAFIQQTLQRTRLYLEQKWTRIQELDDRRLDLGSLKALDFEDNVSLSLPELDGFISSISERSPESHSVEFSPSSNLLKLSYSSLPTNVLFASSPYMAYNLTAFEHWVASDLSAWWFGNLGCSGTCAALKALMEGYHTAAKTAYSDNPEASSIMILTLIELWIACDKSAVFLFPMLRDYDPGVQLGPLQSLILPSKEQLVRLRNVETYLEDRRAAVCLGGQGSIFRDYGTRNCFSVRFYNASPKHKDLLHEIEADANEERRQKCSELLQKQNQYDSLMRQYNDRNCELQWMNILSQLRSPAVDFKKPLTSLVVLQAIYQAGPRDNEDFRRASHSILADELFPGTLLSAVEEAMGRIEKNWESYDALGIFTSIVARQLSLSTRPDTSAMALMVLSKLRNLGFSWLELLREKRDSTEEEAQRREFAEKIVIIALICSGTFNSLRVHFNLLTGQLLVDGLPLSRLPDTYEQHDSYRELFGGIVLEIMPSSVAGFQFSAKQRYSGYSLHFGLDDPDMLVRASKGDNAFELIPKRVSQGKLPHTFSEDFVHWYDRAAGTVEFRPSRQPWESVVNPWKLVRDGSGWILSKRRSILVNPTSPTGDKLAGILAPLQSRLQINITLAENGQLLEVELPRLKLAFSLEKGGSALHSRQFRGLEIDSNQSIGTLIGLKNKLVLKDPSKGDRRVVVPAGNVLFVRNGDHVSVGMDPSPTSTHVYRLDTTLGLLRDNGSLQSKLFLSYLHAVTSFCLPDTLTHCTGTEQALSILKSAAVKSVPFLTAENMDLLQRIEALTPRRNYYPEHGRVMQTIQWNPRLPILAQNSQFHQCVMELWNQNKLSKIYYPKDYVTAPEPAKIHPNMHNFSTLIRRDNVRSSTFHISGFGAEEFTDALDATYNSRDLEQSSERSKRANLAAAMAFHRQPHLQYQLSCSQGFKSHFLDVLKTVGTVQGPGSLESSDSTLVYDGGWLQNHPGHWAKLWCWLHRESQSASSHKITKPQVMLWLTTMAFSSEADMDIIQVAALMFSLPQIQAIRPPSISHFRLNEGDSIDGSVLEPLIRPAHLSIYQCPEARLEMRLFESRNQWEGRKQELYRSNQTQATQWLVNCLASDWPRREPTSRWQRMGIVSDYINIDQAADAVNAKFKSCYENMLFSQYLELVESVIDDQSIHPLEVVDLHYENPQSTSVRRKTFISPEDLFASSLPESIPEAPRLSETTQRVSSARSHLESLIRACKSKASSLYEMKYAMELKHSLDSLGSGEQAQILDLGPEELRHELERHLNDSVKHVDLLFETMTYALALTTKQRAQRLIDSLHNRNDLERELKNEGHTNWDPMKHPDSLLLEVESDIMIRDVQERIAAKMRQPDGQNAAMQLNMGEGKSTVIAPAVTAALADGSRLVRVVVAKPQSRQMLHMLVSKLGGLLNRRIFHLPFSRTLRLNISDAQVIYDECERCIAVGGVMLVQPEQLLSLKLMGLESLIASLDSPGKEQIGRSLLQTQHLFDTKSRDIVDESDENFSVKFELIYTMGQQGPIEFAPERWMVIQTVLPIGGDLRTDMASEAEEVEKGNFWSETTRPYLLLLRGLFAQGVLAFAFGHKRWRVNYGLDNTRQPPTKLAVPFRAKDFPTPRSEFSHPDVVILLTCCCYYYGGLSDDDLTTAFGRLLESDQADAEYQEWIADSNHLPGAFRQLMGVNMKDTFQCKAEVFPSFRYAKRVIDYFLEFIVFPKQMKEFPQKLSTSGWDIGAVKTHPTTGFSGTIDSRAVLPLDVSYLALEEQKFTNAHVLKTLLRSENGLIFLGPISKNTDGVNHDLSHRGSPQQPMSEAETLLSVVVGQKELPWLEMSHAQDPTVQGAIFFDDNEELMVVDIHGYTECLRTSPYGEQLDVCLVFLDEAHTRGTDLKLPQDYRAAVTLGASLTKDRLAQACMRMRRLGQGQSVVFCVPQEIQTIIRERILPEGETKAKTESIKIRDVLEWAISETHMDIRKSMPLWAAQGERFERQRLLWDEARTDTGIEMTAEQAAKFLEVEAQTLEQRYRPKPVVGPRTDREATTDRLRQIQARCEDVGSTHVNEATLQEEQERELSPEIEQERQLERPPPAIAALHSIHEDLRNFVSSGIILRNSSAFVPAFETLRKTSANNYLDVGMFPKDILVTVDFAETVEAVISPGGGGVLDAYQRPIQWVLSSQPHSWQHVVIISPHEAQELLPVIQSSGKTTLHIYAPRPNLEIRPMDSLDLYTVPSSAMEAMTSIPIHLKTQLNFFAGQLYFNDFSEYTAFCDMLRLSWRETSEGIIVAPDGFIVSWPPRTSDDTDGSAASAPAQASTFTEIPNKASKVFLMMARRDCQPIEKTHVGRALDGALLRKTDFEIPHETASRGNAIGLSL